ncbi:hypothetical protein OsI_22497 [Oryza sativa Indica Group]|uniref:Uncharacterized protein n=1 Tax=Oryza sativa subsp. indica TaxID=39946 RepID=A2YBL4_ORYSI|nr:hypothetical protein OsI_22497 [Oryza sativa Indica Group]
MEGHQICNFCRRWIGGVHGSATEDGEEKTSMGMARKRQWGWGGGGCGRGGGGRGDEVGEDTAAGLQGCGDDGAVAPGMERRCSTCEERRGRRSQPSNTANDKM